MHLQHLQLTGGSGWAGNPPPRIFTSQSSNKGKEQVKGLTFL